MSVGRHCEQEDSLGEYLLDEVPELFGAFGNWGLLTDVKMILDYSLAGI